MIPHGTEYPHSTHDIPHGTEHLHGTQDIPHIYHDILHGNEHPHGTEHTLYRVLFDLDDFCLVFVFHR